MKARDTLERTAISQRCLEISDTDQQAAWRSRRVQPDISDALLQHQKEGKSLKPNERKRTKKRKELCQVILIGPREPWQANVMPSTF